MDTTPDQQAEILLLQKTGRGDRASFEQLYERFSGILYTTVLRVLNDQKEAEDVLQDVFIQIWEKAELYNPERGKPFTWALTLTRNKAIDRLRSLQRRSRLNNQVEKETGVANQIHQPNSADEVDALQKGVLVRDAVMRLSQDQREAIEMAFFGGLTQNEIAIRLHQPLGTVKARIRRGMMRLKDLIEPQLG